MLANNETGVIQPVAEAAALVARRRRLAARRRHPGGRQDRRRQPRWAPTRWLSAHKLGGPQGVGALLFGPRAEPSRRQHGGGQERGRRGGTENVPGIAGFGAAAAAAAAELAAGVRDEAAGATRAAEAALKAAAPAALMGEGRRAPAQHPLRRWCRACRPRLQVMALDLAGVMVAPARPARPARSSPAAAGGHGVRPIWPRARSASRAAGPRPRRGPGLRGGLGEALPQVQARAA